MTGWEKVGALTALYVVGMLWANWAMLRRVRGAVAARASWTADDFDAMFADSDPAVPPVVRTVLAPWYGPGVVPRPEDTLRRFLKMSRYDIDEAARAALGQVSCAPVDVPELADVAAMVRFVGNHSAMKR